MLITQVNSDGDEGDVCSSEDNDFIMISETITTRSGRVASDFLTRSLWKPTRQEFLQASEQ
ncbi:hypothetical protein P5673_023888 [Acropora cervicornis]|uniref:Uncharacterized protein n=1 Tax=Acropora cervicornis TaxID=6130 RepID=A0AAD9Q4K2_ACRCE|nr:hypothetical protein P5673_023888 [Acropora cervicornis]